VGLALAVLAGIAVALVLSINSSDQGSTTAAARAPYAARPVAHTDTKTAAAPAPYTARPDEGLGFVQSQASGYTGRPDEGLAPIRIAHSARGYTAHPDEGLAPISPQSAEEPQPSYGGDRLGGRTSPSQHRRG
jgi:hypothetical protein